MTKLSVNLNKFALIRNSRNNDVPNILSMANRAIISGANGITVHPRPDQRHTRYRDVYDLSEMIKQMSGIEFNVEGNPTQKFVDVVCDTEPDQVTLVPDSPDQLTSDHGWDVISNQEILAPLIDTFKSHGIRVSLFLDAGNKDQVLASKEVGADRIELYTEPYADAFGLENQESITEQFAQTSKWAGESGLDCNAGHDLSLKNLEVFLSQVPNIKEVSIGHAIVCESFDFSFEETVKKYMDVIIGLK